MSTFLYGSRPADIEKLEDLSAGLTSAGSV